MLATEAGLLFVKICAIRGPFFAPNDSGRVNPLPRRIAPAMIPRMNVAQLAGRIDHTILKPEATPEEVLKVAAEAVEHRFASVCISPVHVARTAAFLAGRIPVCTVIGFPAGANKATVKAIEATSSIKDGAGEIDVVAHLPHLASANLAAAKGELLEIVRAARATRPQVLIKVIIESAYLLSLGAQRGEAAIAVACQAARESGCDFVKTSTGYHAAGGASLEAIKLMKKHGEELLLKASGGIRDLRTALAMIEAGADRIGASASVAILSELRTA